MLLSGNPFVSVIIPTYNRAHSIGDAIESVLCQTYKDYEIIVVDDGSSDKTEEAVKKYLNKIKYIRQENLGVSSARNRGIKNARGDWIAFLDSDDLWLPDKLKIQIADITKYPKAVSHIIDSLIVDLSGKEYSLLDIRNFRVEISKNSFRERPLIDVLKCQFFTSSWLIRNEAVQRAGLFDERKRIFEDLDFLARVSLQGSFIVSTLVGVKIRRLSNDELALSHLYQRRRIEALESFAETLRKLKEDSRLTPIEKSEVKRRLSGSLWEIAMAYKNEKEWGKAIAVSLKSISDDPGLRSVARVGLSWAGLWQFFRQNFRKTKTQFRRSEFPS